MVPFRYPDGYHTCYTLAGLSATQHHTYYREASGDTTSTGLNDAFHWASCPRGLMTAKQTEPDITNIEDRLPPIHPIYVIPWPAVERAASWYQSKEGF